MYTLEQVNNMFTPDSVDLESIYNTLSNTGESEWYLVHFSIIRDFVKKTDITKVVTSDTTIPFQLYNLYLLIRDGIDTTEWEHLSNDEQELHFNTFMKILNHCFLQYKDISLSEHLLNRYDIRPYCKNCKDYYTYKTIIKIVEGLCDKNNPNPDIDLSILLDRNLVRLSSITIKRIIKYYKG